ncbi:MAG: hypothetical protein FWB75_09290 [Oscillospiraceae bacterium]|nr:hypothetical protein [Oscillospiraceae bacterium]
MAGYLQETLKVLSEDMTAGFGAMEPSMLRVNNNPLATLSHAQLHRLIMLILGYLVQLRTPLISVAGIALGMPGDVLGKYLEETRS